MNRRNALLVAATLVLFLGSAFTSPTKGSSAPAKATALAPAADPDRHFEQVRAEYIILDGNRDDTNTTCSIVNKSLSKTLYLGDVYALGPDGLGEVLAIDTALNGLAIPPLGSLDFPVDPAHFPGLQPKRQDDARGLESVVVSWTGSAGTLRLNAAIHLEQSRNVDNRVITRIEGHCAIK